MIEHCFNVLKRMGKYLNRLGKLTIYHSIILSNFNYCPVIWHFCSEANTKKMETIQERALKFMYNENHSTYEELLAKSKLSSLNENKLSSVLYRLMYLLKTKHQYSFKWLNHIESIFNSTGMGFIFTNQFPVYDKSVFNQILRDQFVQKWLSDIYSSSRGQIYSVFKKDFCIENYLLRLSEHSRIWITKFRTSNLHLPI